VALSITVPMIEKDLALNAEQFGIIFGSFFFGYAVFNFIGGLAVDKFGATLVMGLAVGLWSLFCGLTAVATGFYSMLVLRVLFGMAEGPICASANKMINGWFPKKQAATAVGFLSAGSPLGGAVAGPIVGYLALAFGWRPAFMIIFAIGIVWMIAWFFIAANSPEKHKKVSQEELKLINKMKEEEVALETIENQTAHSLGYYLKQPIILVTAFAFFCYNYILFFFLSWFPSYLVQQHHLDIKQMSLTTMIPWIVGFVGLAGTVSSVVPAVLLMSVSIFFLYVTGAIYWAIIQDVVHKSRVGGASGFIHLIGSVSGIVGPIVTGYIVQSTGKFDSAFVLAGTIAALGALLVLFVIKTPRVTMKASQA
ncbi:TPA: MFS transporter, partial [Klebsiella pneumoniae]